VDRSLGSPPLFPMKYIKLFQIHDTVLLWAVTPDSMVSKY
jgi:hypothetical protein